MQRVKIVTNLILLLKKTEWPTYGKVLLIFYRGFKAINHGLFAQHASLLLLSTLKAATRPKSYPLRFFKKDIFFQNFNGYACRKVPDTYVYCMYIFVGSIAELFYKKLGRLSVCTRMNFVGCLWWYLVSLFYPRRGQQKLVEPFFGV